MGQHITAAACLVNSSTGLSLPDELSRRLNIGDPVRAHLHQPAAAADVVCVLTWECTLCCAAGAVRAQRHGGPLAAAPVLRGEQRPPPYPPWQQQHQQQQSCHHHPPAAPAEDTHQGQSYTTISVPVFRSCPSQQHAHHSSRVTWQHKHTAYSMVAVAWVSYTHLTPPLRVWHAAVDKQQTTAAPYIDPAHAMQTLHETTSIRTMVEQQRLTQRHANPCSTCCKHTPALKHPSDTFLAHPGDTW